MAKLQLKDITPDMIKQMAKLGSAEEIAAFVKESGFEISDKGAARLKEQIDKTKDLSEEELAKVAGGYTVIWKWGSYTDS